MRGDLNKVFALTLFLLFLVFSATITAGEADTVISATVDIKPSTLNLKDKGRYMTCLIELPEGYDVGDINVLTIELNDTICVFSCPAGIGDSDNDTIPDLMVKLDRQSVIAYISNQGIKYGNVILTVTGNLKDGTAFEGSDIIRVIFPDVNKDKKIDVLDLVLIVHAFGTDSTHPWGNGWFQWNPAADVNEDSVIDAEDLAWATLNFDETLP